MNIKRGSLPATPLLRHPLFARLSRDQQRTAARLATQTILPAGRRIIKQGEAPREFLIVIDGEMSVTRDGERIATISGGDFFGEVALLTGSPRAASVTAVKQTRLYACSRREFVSLMDIQPVKIKVLTAAVERASLLLHNPASVLADRLAAAV